MAIDRDPNWHIDNPTQLLEWTAYVGVAELNSMIAPEVDDDYIQWSHKANGAQLSAISALSEHAGYGEVHDVEVTSLIFGKYQEESSEEEYVHLTDIELSYDSMRLTFTLSERLFEHGVDDVYAPVEKKLVTIGGVGGASLSVDESLQPHLANPDVRLSKLLPELDEQQRTSLLEAAHVANQDDLEFVNGILEQLRTV